MAYAEKDYIKKWLNFSDDEIADKVEKNLELELSMYENYVNGNVYRATTYKINKEEIKIAERYINFNSDENIDIELLKKLLVVEKCGEEISYYGIGIFHAYNDVTRIKKYKDVKLVI